MTRCFDDRFPPQTNAENTKKHLLCLFQRRGGQECSIRNLWENQFSYVQKIPAMRFIPNTTHRSNHPSFPKLLRNFGFMHNTMIHPIIRDSFNFHHKIFIQCVHLFFLQYYNPFSLLDNHFLYLFL